MEGSGYTFRDTIDLYLLCMQKQVLTSSTGSKIFLFDLTADIV